MSEKIKFKYGTTIDGKTPEVGDFVAINKGMNEATQTVNSKLGSMYRGNKIIGTTEADKLVTTEDLTVTGVTVGNLSDGKILSAGTDVMTLLKQMLMKELGVNKTEPSVALSGLTSKTIEYGDNVSTTLTLTLTDGKYTGVSGYNYTQPMGCTLTSVTIDGQSATLAANKLSATYSYSKTGLTSNTSISGSAVVSAPANNPVSNMGNNITTGLYTGGTKTATAIALVVQKKWFIGSSAIKEADMTWNSAGIRGLNLFSNWVSTKTASVTFPAGAKQQVIAVPSGSTFTAKDGAGADITGTFVKQTNTVPVACGTGQINANYDVYVAPANAGLAAASKATITLN